MYLSTSRYIVRAKNPIQKKENDFDVLSEFQIYGTHNIYPITDSKLKFYEKNYRFTLKLFMYIEQIIFLLLPQ